MRGGWLRRRGLVPYAILLAALCVTIATTRYVHATRAREDAHQYNINRHQFTLNAEVIRGAVMGRLDAYVAMLVSGAGLFAASTEVSREEFKAYVDRLEIARRYPGLQGIGFSRVIRAPERATVLAEARRAIAGFEFWPPQPAGDINAIIYLEPSDVRNRRALGYDMGSEANRREAMARARDSGAPAGTGTVRLVQEFDGQGDEQKGFLIYVPVYRGGHVPPAVEERSAALVGFVYSPFRVGDLLRAAVAELPELPPFDVFDGPPSEGAVLHRSGERAGGPARFQVERTLEVADRTWTMLVYGGDDLDVRSSSLIVGVVGLGGVILSLLLFIVTRGQIRARTDAEQAAEVLRASEERLRAANRAKDDFLATISHELRTPLNAIVGWTAMLRNRAIPPEMQAHAVDVIARNAAAQTRLVEDLLDMSRAASGHLALHRRELDARAVLEAAVETMQPMCAAASLSLDVRLEEPLGRIVADEDRLQQIVTNLLSNAIKFTPAGGAVAMSAERADGTLTIHVSDTGVGVDPAFMPFIFERFRQEDSSSTRSHAGVGLGLAIARHLVTLHGGTISAESAGTGQGARFEVRLPAQ